MGSSIVKLHRLVKNAILISYSLVEPPITFYKQPMTLNEYGLGETNSFWNPFFKYLEFFQNIFRNTFSKYRILLNKCGYCASHFKDPLKHTHTNHWFVWPMILKQNLKYLVSLFKSKKKILKVIKTYHRSCITPRKHCKSTAFFLLV